jgi:hypothetical protein
VGAGGVNFEKPPPRERPQNVFDEHHAFFNRLAAERGVPRCQLSFQDYGREIIDTTTGKALARLTYDGWVKLGVDNQVLEEIARG